MNKFFDFSNSARIILRKIPQIPSPLMNSQLEKLFQTYNLSEKDKYDFRQIYDLLPAYKKVRAVENFVTIMLSVEGLREKLYVEHEILFGDTLEKIETKLNILKKDLQKTPVQNTTNT